ncbi:MAG: GMC family oxidoreductase [Acetobacteraceae bacterium]|nr:GMC family oxidoreductase [Acetobacteraceae bacterium]
MIIDADAAIAGGMEFDADVCVLGGGAAGLVLAAELAQAGVAVLVLEAGGLRADARSQREFYAGEVADPAAHPWLEHFRALRLGGASTLWGGRCTPFDPIDFEERPWVPLSGWPIPAADLGPFYAAAAGHLEIGKPDFDCRSALAGLGGDRETIASLGAGGQDIETTKIERFSRPTDVGKRLRGALQRSPRATVALRARAVGIDLAPGGRRVERVRFRTGGGAEASARARRYVVALGGLETTRLLLCSDDVAGGGIGNHSGWLGRCYMSHLAGTFGTLRVPAGARAPVFDYELDADGIYCRRRLALSEDAQRRRGILNAIFRIHHPDPADPAHRDAILSAMYLVKDLLLYEYSRKMRADPLTAARAAAHFGNVVRGLPAIAAFAPNWVLRRNLSRRKLPSLVRGATRGGAYALEFHSEQAPNPDSRLTLAPGRDAHGLRRLRVDWRVTDLDRRSVAEAYRALRDEFSRAGAGAIEFDEAAAAEAATREGAYGGHHLGSTRMSSDPSLGVVDRACQVHGVGNLFVASGSVFPTSSQANPTLTIVALAARLAAHLGADLRAGNGVRPDPAAPGPAAAPDSPGQGGARPRQASRAGASTSTVGRRTPGYT